MPSVPSAPPEPRDRAEEGQRATRLTQAPVSAVDDDGLIASVVGTIGFAIATAVMWVGRNSLVNDGRGWWLWVGVAGTVLGLIGIIFLRARRRRRASQEP